MSCQSCTAALNAGVLVVEECGLSRMTRAERRRVSAELRRLAARIDPRDIN